MALSINRFIKSEETTLKKGSILDRYDFNGVSEEDGVHRGLYASPKKEDGSAYSFNDRALKGNESDYKEFYELVVLEDLSVDIGPVMPWFNRQANGIQIRFSDNIENLSKQNKIELINIRKLK